MSETNSDSNRGETRPAQAGETDTTRFGMEPGDNTDISSPPPDAEPMPPAGQGQHSDENTSKEDMR